MAINFDSSKTTAHIVPALKKIKTDIDNAYNACDKTKSYLPSTFTYRSSLTDMCSNLNNFKNQIKTLETNLNQKIELSNNLDLKNKNRTSDLARRVSQTGVTTNEFLKQADSFVSGQEQIISGLDEQIKEKEKRQKEVDEEIKELKSKISLDEFWIAISLGIYKGDPMLNGWKIKLSELEKEKQKLSDEIHEINQQKKNFTNYLKELSYNNLSNNIDFETFSKVNLTEEEATSILNIILAFEASSPGDNPILTFDLLYGNVTFEEVKKRFDGIYSNQVHGFSDIDWELVESAYKKGFSVFELSVLNPDLAQHASSYIYGDLSNEDQTLLYNLNRLNWMTETERKTMIYLYQSQNPQAACEYLNFKEQEINSRIGMYKALEFLQTIDVNDPKASDYIETTLKGLGDGSLNFLEGIDNAFGGMDGVISAQQYQALYIMSGLTSEQLSSIDFLTDDVKEKLKGLNENKTLAGTYEISSSIGNMLPAMATSALVSLVATPAAGNLVGTTLMGLSAGGNSAESAYQQGYGYWESIFYGTLSGASEAAIGYLLGGIPGLSKLSDLPGFKGFVVNILSEGGEEALQSILDPYFLSMATGTTPEVNWDEVIKSGIYGMITAGILNGGTMVINGVSVNISDISEDTIDVIYEAEQKGISVDYTKVTSPQYINYLRNSTIESTTNNNYRYNSVEENIIEIIKRHDSKYGEGSCLERLNMFIDPNNVNYGNYNVITNTDSARSILSMYTPYQIQTALNNLYNNDYGTIFGNSTICAYGCDQGGIEALCLYKYKGPTYTIDMDGKTYILKDGDQYSYRWAMKIYNEAKKTGQVKPIFKKTAISQEYMDLKDKLISQGFSNQDASVIMSSINDAGACSYAATVNEIFASFAGKEVEFEQKFGYPMYKVENGKKILNSNELLLDLYVYCNKRSNGGNFILENNTLNSNYLKYGREDVFGRVLLDAENQQYMSGFNTGKSVNQISSFLNSKGVNYNSEWMFSNRNAVNITDGQFADLISSVSSQLNAGKSVSMDIYQIRDNTGNIVSGNTINMYSTNPNVYNSTSTATWSEGGGHAVFITGMGTDCFYVSSWGQEYAIPFADLQNGGIFNIFSATIY